MKNLILTTFFLSIVFPAFAQYELLIEQIEGQLFYLDELPLSLELDELVADSFMYFFIERTDHVLSDDLYLDLMETGTYFPDSIPDEAQTWEALMPGVVSAGTSVHSVYFHYDNETYNDDFDLYNYLNCIGQYQVNGQIVFNFPVLGIIMRASGNQPSLRDSDGELGLPGIDYCEHNLSHFPGINIIDGCQSDRFSLSEDRRTLTVRNNTDIHHDNYRVILDADPATSVTRYQASDLIRYYPNPTRDFVYFTLTEEESWNYILLDAVGRPLASGLLACTRPTVSLIDYPSGLYFISLNNETGGKMLKIQKY